MPNQRFTLYKIYYKSIEGKDTLVYIGRTKQPMNTRLHGHFFKKPMLRSIDIHQVSKIETASFQSEADMYIAEIILINRFKPPLNKDDKAIDEITLQLPDFPFEPYFCPHIERWKKEIEGRDLEFERFKKEKNNLFLQHREKRKEIFSSTSLSVEEKRNSWFKWLEDVYEPALEHLKEKEIDSSLW